MTILFPGANWNKKVYNTLDEDWNGGKNPNYPSNAANSSKTALTWRKYLDPMSQYADVWDTECCPIVFRYADVLLTWAEAENELNGPSADVYSKINMVRKRVGMPDVDQSKYNSKALDHNQWQDGGRDGVERHTDTHNGNRGYYCC